MAVSLVTRSTSPADVVLGAATTAPPGGTAATVLECAAGSRCLRHGELSS